MVSGRSFSHYSSNPSVDVLIVIPDSVVLNGILYVGRLNDPPQR
jgi:hypothetical protein